MTDLTPEAVKAARERVTQFLMMELPGQPMMMHMGTSNLVNELDAIARDWLRLKEVEKAGKALERAAEACLPSTDEPLSHDAALRLIFTKRAFRAVVEGK